MARRWDSVDLGLRLLAYPEANCIGEPKLNFLHAKKQKPQNDWGFSLVIGGGGGNRISDLKSKKNKITTD
jgi:hypothetical protein